MNEQVHDLHTFMAQATGEMASEYERIYARSTEDPGTAGDEGESNWAAFLKDWLPAGYHVRTKGRLLAADGRMSKQIDVIVLKPSYPPKLLEKKVWLADGVAAVFECKNTLTAAHVVDSVRRCAEFKNLFQPRAGTPRKELISPLVYGLLAHSHSWKGPASEPAGNVSSALERGGSELEAPRLGIDAVCVSDLATWTSTHMASYDSHWNLPRQKELEAVFGAPMGPATGLMCSEIAGAHQAVSFRPVGALIAYLTSAFAWDDAMLRPIADYYRQANLLGSGAGTMRFWPLSVYSLEVQARIRAGGLASGRSWDEWEIVGI